MQTRQYINGEWVEGAAGSISSYNPATGEVIAEVRCASSTQVDDAITAAREALSGEWANLLPVQRAAVLFKIADLIEANAEEFAQLETLDQGQPIGVARQVSVAGAANHFRYFAGFVTKIQGTTNPISFPDTLHYTRREPVGVNALITPWNFPLMILAWKLAPALATGNSVVIKPSEVTPLTSIKLVEVCEQAGVPAGVVNIVTGAGDVGAMLSSHMGVDHLSYTGSTPTGKAITHAAADSNLKRLTLELGGKAPSIITASADIDSAVAGNVGGALLNSGQVCAAYTRFYVDSKVHDEFVEKLASAAASMHVGPGNDEKSQLTPVVSEKHLGHITNLIEAGRSEGAELVTGGHRIDREGYFVEPTVFAGVDEDNSIAKQEIFGPVLSVMKYDGELDEVIARANDSEYGLAAAVWTSDIAESQRIANGLRSGAVFVNMLPIPDMAAPWGGYKQSGWGREMGPQAIECYTETKAVWLHYGS
ncbi:aldehyde dehydrogenase family protein [Corynebacterium pseudopelargi]|uniref:Phenylacetaldehyde dehydrogenase n=1 Tax=Corynebacterium pseudopelargi TaxID=2080757 RepID=A0A3G6IVR9_9CORY|nr:aldehyde dehydrogenase family protein [Corynebacterium pseudopelargi]AZA09746.1 Phenylacetaldehyde dehydrogenase [Corynebacterium pseudopelargi]